MSLLLHPSPPSQLTVNLRSSVDFSVWRYSGNPVCDFAKRDVNRRALVSGFWISANPMAESEKKSKEKGVSVAFLGPEASYTHQVGFLIFFFLFCLEVF